MTQPPGDPLSKDKRSYLLTMLTGFSLVSYVLRSNIAIAAKPIITDLGLTEIQMGQVFSGFLLGYALFQVPSGYWSDHFGPRRVLLAAGSAWFVLTALCGTVVGPPLCSRALALGTLWVLRFLLGVSVAAVYPAGTRAIVNWVPLAKRGFANGVMIAGAPIGSAITAPLIASLITVVGWRWSFFLSSLIAVVCVGLWFRHGADYPEQHLDKDHPKGQGPALLHLAENITSAELRVVLRNRNLAIICASYFLYGQVYYIFIFWLYIYLTDVRGFSVLRGGFFASLPYWVAVAMAPLGGFASDRLSRERLHHRGRRYLVMGAFGLAAVLTLGGAAESNAYRAIIDLSLGVGLVMATEGAFWSSITDEAGRHAGAAGGVLNTAGNLGGVISTALVPFLVRSLGWVDTFAMAAIVLATAGGLWSFVGTGRARSPKMQ